MFVSGGMIPTYLLISQLHMINTIWAIIVPGCVSVFNIIVIRTYIESSIPNEIQEAAKIDGAGYVRTFLQVILPLAKSGLVTLVLISTMWSWNDYINPLIFLSDDRLFTLTVGLQRFQESNSSNYAVIMAGTVSAILPVVILFIIFQKQFVASLASSGIKE